MFYNRLLECLNALQILYLSVEFLSSYVLEEQSVCISPRVSEKLIVSRYNYHSQIFSLRLQIPLCFLKKIKGPPILFGKTVNNKAHNYDRLIQRLGNSYSDAWIYIATMLPCFSSRYQCRSYILIVLVLRYLIIENEQMIVNPAYIS